ncbi:MAG: glutamine-hydrolyzing GMP synthase [Gammaproteobacteria bacterium]
MLEEKILVIDYGSQYTQLIARRVRENNAFCEVHHSEYLNDQSNFNNVIGIILSGGPNSVSKNNDYDLPDILFKKNIPILGICFGMQLICKKFNGKVKKTSSGEYGKASLEIIKNVKILEGLEKYLEVWMSHGDSVVELPKDFSAIATTNTEGFSAIKADNQEIYGIQFHPEVTHTLDSGKIISNFVKNICCSRGGWTTKNIIEQQVSRIKEKVKDDHVILGLSGGVDSSVAAAIIHQAIKKKLTCIFIDNGLLRLNEKEQVKEGFKDFKNINIIYVDASNIFLERLKNVFDPEEKRKIIGKTFIDVFQEEAKKIKNAKWLAQGTIYPDVIESAASSDQAHLIKSHHNVGGLPKDMELRLLEPLRELFKDEVRKLGIELGLDKKLINRHPFPGPGLAVRILGEVKKDYADILRQADNIFIEMLHERNLYNKISQAFTVFMPVKSVGVTGDGRTYGNVVSLRAVKTIDFMTAKPFEFPFSFLEEVSTKIINNVPGISRVCLDISSKPPATIEWE